jgi:hypothetical protein
VLFFRQDFALEDAIDIHAFAPLEVAIPVTNGIPLGRSLSYRLHRKFRPNTKGVVGLLDAGGEGAADDRRTVCGARASKYKFAATRCLSFTPFIRLKRACVVLTAYLLGGHSHRLHHALRPTAAEGAWNGTV